jgi:hypothetical protein
VAVLERELQEQRGAAAAQARQVARRGGDALLTLAPLGISCAVDALPLLAPRLGLAAGLAALVLRVTGDTARARRVSTARQISIGLPGRKATRSGSRPPRGHEPRLSAQHGPLARGAKRGGGACAFAATRRQAALSAAIPPGSAARGHRAGRRRRRGYAPHAGCPPAAHAAPRRSA